MSVSARREFRRGNVAELKHCLRTSLNHILGYTETLLEQADDGTPVELVAKLREVRVAAHTLLKSRQLQPAAGGQRRRSEIGDLKAAMASPIEGIVRSAAMLMQIARPADLPEISRISSTGGDLLDLIRTPTAAGPETSARVRGDVVSEIPQRGKAAVLIVDDDKANRDILSRQLRRMGYTAVVARDGAQGLAKLNKARFDIALIDFMMPGMEGLEMLEAIHNNPNTRDIPVIMISAPDELSGVSRCIQHGAEDYLFKPFEPVLLGTRIGAALERSRLRARERDRTADRERMSEELQRSNEDLKRFAYGASHDLQAPLRTITTHLQLLDRRLSGQLSPDQLEVIRFAIDAALRMNQLIKNLLAYSQATTDERVVGPVASEKVLTNTLEDLQSAIAESGAKITYDPLPTITADDVQMHQLFLNLIGNGIKYRGSEPPLIHVAARREDANWHFTISDNGVGIPAEYTNEIFKLFRRLHGHDRPGTGLGLSICKRILDRIGGRIWVESQVGLGSTFHFVIPDEQMADHVIG